MNNQKLVVAGVIVAAVTTFLIWPQEAVAGDDPVAQVAYTSAAACSAKLRPKTKYAVQCTTDCYVRLVQEWTAADGGLNPINDGGVAAVTSTTSILLGAGKLYDAPTTYDTRYICVVRSASDGTAKIFINRGPTE